MAISHRDRVRTALAHERPDRCPMQISFTPEFAARLRADLGMNGEGGHNPHGGGNPYDIERLLDMDLLLTSVGWANSYYRESGTYTDEWGVTFSPVAYETPFGIGHYTEMTGFPLADNDALDRYTPPDPGRPELYRDARALVERFGGEYWIVGVTVTTVFETAWALRGFERLLFDFVEDPDRAGRILDIPFRYHLAAAKELVRLGVDMIWTGDDVGTQHGLLISPATWRRFLKPLMAKFFAELRAIRPDIVIAYHSDGDIRPIIDDLVEIGLDVLNPVQPACMDPVALARRYGDRLSFWGTIDEQRTLPFGTPAEVAGEVRDRIETVGRYGGLIVGPTHHVQLDTPLENFHAMHRAVLELDT